MANLNEGDSIDDQYFHDATDDETLQQLTPEQLQRLQNNMVMAKRLRKELCKQPDVRLRISLAETLWQSAIMDLLKHESTQPTSERLEWYKEKIKMHSQLTAMRIMSFIDTYPNTADSEEFRKKSHQEYRKWIGVK